MKIGFGRKCLTPEKKAFYLIGYKGPYRDQPVDGIHDDIFCNGLLVEVNGKKLFLISLDFLELEDEMADEIKTKLANQYQLERELIILSVTHNHSSVMSYHKHWHSGEFDQEYYDHVLTVLCKLYEQCSANLQEAAASYGSQVIEGYFGNRNHPGELADNEVQVIIFKDMKGEKIAALVNIAVHSTILGAENNYLTGDLAGQLCSELFQLWGIFPVILVGAAADSSNRHYRLGNDFAELARVSQALAARITQIEVEEVLCLDQMTWQTLSHTIYNDMKISHEQAALFLRSDSPLKNLGLIKKCEDLLKKTSFYERIEFMVLQLGELQIYVFPGELGSKFGIELKAASKRQHKVALIAGYSNGFHHYFLPEEEYGLSFETIGTPIPRGEPEKMIRKMIQSGQFLAKAEE